MTVADPVAQFLARGGNITRCAAAAVGTSSQLSVSAEDRARGATTHEPGATVAPRHPGPRGAAGTETPGAIVAAIGAALSDLSQAEFADVIREMVRQCVKNGGAAVANDLRRVIDDALP